MSRTLTMTKYVHAFKLAYFVYNVKKLAYDQTQRQGNDRLKYLRTHKRKNF